MITRRERAIARLVEAWVSFYTIGLPADIRKARRDEMRSEVWEHLTYARTEGSPRGDILSRMARGIPEDILWRIQESNGGVGDMFMFHGKAYLRALIVLGMLFFLFPLGIGGFILALMAVVIPGAMIAAPFYYRTEAIRFGSWVADTMGESLLVSLAGVALLLLAVFLIGLVARFVGPHISLRIGRLRLGN
jgi:hypothetical protein